MTLQALIHLRRRTGHPVLLAEGGRVLGVAGETEIIGALSRAPRHEEASHEERIRACRPARSCWRRPAAVGPAVGAEPGARVAFDLQGHRGARGLRPENTLAGFAFALELGVTTLELDCAVTRDGVVVVSHDPVLNPDHTRDEQGRFLDAAGPPIVDADAMRSCRRYDVGRLRPGSEYAARFPDQQAVDGERIPRLADVFALVRSTRQRRACASTSRPRSIRRTGRT